MTRDRLPNRRPAATLELAYDGKTYAVSIGYDPATGAVREVFAGSGTKAGSAMDGILSDACILASIALQHGIAPADLAASMGRLESSGERTSPIGALLDLLAAECARQGVIDATATFRPAGASDAVPASG